MTTLLSSYRKDRKSLLDAASTGSQMPPRVSIGSNRFTLIDPSGARTEVPFMADGPVLDVVFVDRNEHMSKLLWNLEGSYNPNEAAPPLCFSDNGVAPSTQALEPQSPTCMGCRHNVIGSVISKISGARIKLCEDVKKLAVVVRGFQGVYEFEVKKGSFKTWNNFTNWLRLQKLPDGGRPDLSDVVTRIRFIGQGLLSFEGIEIVTDDHEMATQVVEVWERNEKNDITGMMVGRYDQPAQGVLPAPAVVEPQKVAPPVQQPVQPQSNPFAMQGQAAPAAPKRPTRAKKEGAPAPIEPAPPVAPPQRTSPPGDIAARLESLFKLPTAK